MYQFIRDVYKNNRGSWSRVLDVTCHYCKKHLFFYQKDGPGLLKRSYIDRIIDLRPKISKEFHCFHCNELLGIFQPYKKENNRPAFSWLVGALEYQIVPQIKLKGRI
ncbi:hypothetical protein A3D00_02625 [Candidatus Woesebacteria bacterium RIFCSPHIGHO2_02_FULL_38_9]|uniref:Uncharacterized protein n=1 Tax=Candidatus Woesebacteria bacterium RIFCSPHIGHO2_01_FULL_39_28 TaxID=1802496 RepID=A0A1F7YEP3_9BACT|nr:MAG: hypothetical protein A2627_01620 [Candidatus Woesebacteria bacterium RIFCSPHIGHO2_01_FULL_39_28]OGM35069.1 MAG: hypothetical protein A3D00_02625 [Candidatus Woesebacteria bacterium RIFCSPHIGHO2_02_FULL_38_9]OGM56885.1 MAG: hypothetical protein A3A50_04005 [Candidatus Woesebacteria bacterium RIFCSPLOWO2_01_FULL_38_20]